MTKFGKQWSYYLRAPVLGEFDKRCDSCKDKRSDTNVEIDPYGSHVCSGCPNSGNRILRHDVFTQLTQNTLSRSGVIFKREQKINFGSAAPYSNYRSDFHIFGPDKEAAYDLQIKGAVELNGNQQIRYL